MRRLRRGAAEGAESRLRPQQRGGGLIQTVVHFAAVEAVDARRQEQRLGVGAGAAVGGRRDFQFAPGQAADKTLQNRLHFAQLDRDMLQAALAHERIEVGERGAAGIQALAVVDFQRAQQPPPRPLHAQRRQRARRVGDELIRHLRVGFADDLGPVQREFDLLAGQRRQTARRGLGGAAAGQHRAEMLVQRLLDVAGIHGRGLSGAGR